MKEEVILNTIYRCIEQINEQLPPESRIATSDSTVLVGDGSSLESLSLVTLMVEIEEALVANGLQRLDLLNEAIMGANGVVFSTISELVSWIKRKSG